jgi:hypothetical protein
LQFSIPHSSVDPQGAIYDFLALDSRGFFVFPGANGWLACRTEKEGPNQPPPADPEAIGSGATHQIFAQLPGVENNGHCIPITLIVDLWKPDNGSTSNFAAWEYV